MFAVVYVASLATLECHRALLSTSPVETSDVDCQASDCLGNGQEMGESYLSREQLEHEVQTLCQERDNLIVRLKGSTETFQEQLKLITDKGRVEVTTP